MGKRKHNIKQSRIVEMLFEHEEFLEKLPEAIKDIFEERNSLTEAKMSEYFQEANKAIDLIRANHESLTKKHNDLTEKHRLLQAHYLDLVNRISNSWVLRKMLKIQEMESWVEKMSADNTAREIWHSAQTPLLKDEKAVEDDAEKAPEASLEFNRNDVEV